MKTEQAWVVNSDRVRDCIGRAKAKVASRREVRKKVPRYILSEL